MRKISFKSIHEAIGDILVLPMCEGEPLSPFVKSLDSTLNGAVKSMLQSDSFEAQTYQTTFMTTNGLHAIPRLLFVGLGLRSDLSPSFLQETGGFLATLISKISNVHQIVLDATLLEAEAGEANISLGYLIKEWNFNKYKSKPEPTLEKSFVCLCASPVKATDRFKNYGNLYTGIATARELTSEPANYVYPEVFADRCLELRNIGVEVDVFDEAQLEDIGAHALLAVGKGSYRPARMVVLKWNGGDPSEAPVALVGKGVCFDSGGINIKTTSEIGDMKWDKAGASIVTGIIQTLALMKAPVNVVGVLGLVENMPDGKAMKPGDIISTMSGKTVEVADTDNEGRLVLADCLWYAQQKYDSKIVIDLGTLTLETMGALAGEYAGLFSNNKELSNALIAAGNKSGEKLWQLPLGEAFAKQIHSSIADIKNIGNLGFGESSASAEFLKSFIKPGVRWAHLDIAGVAQTKEDTLLHVPGVTGFGVRLLVQWLTG